jgi:hypothetical protein
MKESETTRINGMDVIPFEQQLAEARERYMHAISDALDEEVSRFLLPHDRIAILHDAAFFVNFLLAVKCAEVRTPVGQVIQTKDGVQEWRQINKQLQEKVGPALVEWGIEARQAQLKGQGEQVQPS